MRLGEPIETAIAFDRGHNHGDLNFFLGDIGSAAKSRTVIVKKCAAGSASVLAVAARFDNPSNLFISKELRQFVDHALALHVGAQPRLHLGRDAAGVCSYRKFGEVLEFFFRIAIEQCFIDGRNFAHRPIQDDLAAQFPFVFVEVLVFVNIDEDKDFDKYKGKLGGKIVLYGPMREVPPVDKALFDRYTEKELEDLAEFPVTANAGGVPPEMQARLRTYMERQRMIDKLAQFFADEKVAGVIEPSRDGKNGGGSGGTFFDDNGATLGRTPYIAEKKVKIPVVVAAIESYGRLYRLTQAHVPVSVDLDVETKFTGDHEHGFDTVAEIPGTDPKLKEQVVMVGGHLDSWIAGTGATDNGAGTIVAMEAVRILKALDVKPRRTIRIALWTGEEQGLFGSKGYVKQHFGSAQLSTPPDQMARP